MKEPTELLDSKEIRLFVRVNKELGALLQDVEKKERRTKSDIIREALSLYFTKDIGDKELLYSALNNSKRLIEYVDKKLEVFFNLWFFSLTSIFASIPDISSYPKEEQVGITKNAIKRKNAMFNAFKKTIKEQPSLFEALLTDFIEHENKV